MESKDWLEIDTFIAQLMQEHNIPGLSVAVVKEGERVYAKGYGARNLEYNIPATPDTLYGIASCTKSITCLAIMQLKEQGKLAIDDPISKYLPVTIQLGDSPINIRHLMSHSSGSPNLGMATLVFWRLMYNRERFIPLSSKTDFYTYINDAQSELVDSPGKRYFYFNSGYTLLGEIIEKVSGESYAKYVVEHILKPLEMNRSTFVRSIFSNDDDRMTGYKFEDGKPVASDLPFNWMIYAAGGLITSVNEWVNYAKMVLNKGMFGETQLIREDSLQEMLTIAIERPITFYGTEGYGYGWGITEDFLGHRLIAHSGGLGIGSSYVGLIPEKHLGVVTAANCGGGQGSVIAHYILAKMLGQDPKTVLPPLQVKERLKKVTGKYANYKDIVTAEVKLKDGLLYFENKELEQNVPMIPKNSTIDTYEFYIYNLGLKTPVVFEITEDGEIDLYIERNRFHKQK